MLVRLLVSALLILPLAACSPGGEPAAAETAPVAAPAPLVEVSQLPVLAARLERSAASNGFMGAVLVARGDEVLFRKAYGMADREAGEPLALDSRFRLASISKQFTAAAILKLQDDGVLNVADPLCRWIQPCPEAWAPVTLHHLLSHTSGIPDLMQRPDWGIVRRTPKTVAELTADTAEYRLSFEPGSRVRYSNAAYNLLGAVIQRATGRTLDQYLREEILEPAGMADTGLKDADGEVIMGYATFPGGIAPQPDYNPSIIFAAGAMYSTLDDMLRWNRALHGGRVLSEQAYGRMIAPHNPPHEGAEPRRPPRDYGYGLFVSALGDRVEPVFRDRQIYHTGSWSGFRNMVTHQPESGVTVIVLGNNYHQRDEVFMIAQIAMAEALGRPIPERIAPR